jgi:uncharacterized metal-binding protein
MNAQPQPLPSPAAKPLAPPLVYSCSGCSSAAQMANYLALKLDRLGAAEMSCIAGVGGDVPSLVKVAKSGRPIVALDGCALQCVVAILGRHDLKPAAHYLLRTFGVKKHRGQDFAPAEADAVLQQILASPDFPRGD